MMNTTRRMTVVEAGVSVLAIVVWVHQRRLTSHADAIAVNAIAGAFPPFSRSQAGLQ